MTSNLSNSNQAKKQFRIVFALVMLLLVGTSVSAAHIHIEPGLCSYQSVCDDNTEVQVDEPCSSCQLADYQQSLTANNHYQGVTNKNPANKPKCSQHSPRAPPLRQHQARAPPTTL